MSRDHFAKNCKLLTNWWPIIHFPQVNPLVPGLKLLEITHGLLGNGQVTLLQEHQHTLCSLSTSEFTG